MDEKEGALELEAWREKTRAGLYDVRERLEAVRTSAIYGKLPGISEWIYQATRNISNILGWFGAPRNVAEPWRTVLPNALTEGESLDETGGPLIDSL